MYQTNQYEGMLAETITMPAFQAGQINAYFATCASISSAIRSRKSEQ